MSTQAVEVRSNLVPEKLEAVLLNGDLSKLSADERVMYYKAVCESVGLNPLTKPFEYISLNNKLTLYALKACTDQLRSVHNISLTIPSRELLDGIYIVTASAKNAQGRMDESTGAVPLESLKGEARANAMMKAETKAKRRVTLSICGMGMLDESEIDSIPGAKPFSEAEAKPAPQKEAEPPEIAELRARIAKRQGNEVFKQLYLSLLDLLGDPEGPRRYGEILHRHGAPASAKDFTSVKQAGDCARDMYLEVQKVISAMEPPVMDAEVVND